MKVAARAEVTTLKTGARTLLSFNSGNIAGAVKELIQAGKATVYYAPLTLQQTGDFRIGTEQMKRLKRDHIQEINAMTLQLTVPNMACSACGDTITKAITAVDSTAKVEANPKTKQVNIETQASETAIKDAIAAVGYTVT